jgi:hypothetical protein
MTMKVLEIITAMQMGQGEAERCKTKTVES